MAKRKRKAKPARPVASSSGSGGGGPCDCANVPEVLVATFGDVPSGGAPVYGPSPVAAAFPVWRAAQEAKASPAEFAARMVGDVLSGRAMGELAETLEEAERRRLAGRAIAEAAGRDVSRMWGYHCRTCGHWSGICKAATVEKLRCIARLVPLWAHLNREIEAAGMGDGLMDWTPAGFLWEHTGHDVVIRNEPENRTEPLFPGNAPLPHGTAGFLHTLADDCLDTAALSVFFDVLEENGHTAAGLRVRRLTPKDGDVLVLEVPPGLAPDAAKIDVHNLSKTTEAKATVYVVPAGADLRMASPEGMALAGWVRHEQTSRLIDLAVAAERERCLTWAATVQGVQARQVRDRIGSGETLTIEAPAPTEETEAAAQRFRERHPPPVDGEIGYRIRVDRTDGSTREWPSGTRAWAESVAGDIAAREPVVDVLDPAGRVVARWRGGRRVPDGEGDTPRFAHDCVRCTFLGRFVHGGRDYDLYYADHGGLPDTVIARYGDDGPEYTSGLELADLDPALGEARRRAAARGLLQRGGGGR